MKIALHTEPNEWPANIVPRGTFAATWQGWFLRLTESDARISTNVSFPGHVACTVMITAETIIISVELGS